MTNRAKAHPSDGHIMRHIHGVQDDWYRIEPQDGADGEWIAADSHTFERVAR